jgi:PRTRC genetic system protein B
MQFNVSTIGSDLTLSNAILVYTTLDRNGTPTAALLTNHEVKMTTGVGKKSLAPQIQPGIPFSRDSMLDLLGSMSERYAINTEILPENVLSISASHMIWWLPAAERRVFFSNKELGNRSAIVPTPPLLFIVAKGNWYVFSLRKNCRPGPDTEVLMAPFFNVYEGGKICVGSAKVPSGSVSISDIPAWESAFFDSAFSALHGGDKTHHPRRDYAFWKEMLDGRYKRFPTSIIKSNKTDLASLVRAIIQKKETGNG